MCIVASTGGRGIDQPSASSKDHPSNKCIDITTGLTLSALGLVLHDAPPGFQPSGDAWGCIRPNGLARQPGK
jgi:hypothetical protein